MSSSLWPELTVNSARRAADPLLWPEPTQTLLLAKADRGIGRQCRPRLSQPGLTPSVNCPAFFSLPLHAGMSDGDGLPQRRHRDSSHISHSKDFWTGWQFGRLLSGLCIGIQKACQRSSRWEIIGNKGGDISCTKDLQNREKGGRVLVNLSEGFLSLVSVGVAFSILHMRQG